MEQLSFNLTDEVAPYYPEPIKSLCYLIDSKVAEGKKVNDLKEQLLKGMHMYPPKQEELYNRTLEFARYYPN
jgi:hypothetical protein